MTSSWKPGPDRPLLKEQEVHIWRSSLDLPEAIRGQLSQTLNLEERERAARFATDQLRNRYLVGRGILRTLLGAYLGQSANDLRFRFGEHEKPFLDGPATVRGMQFNVSHSYDLALFAFSLGREIGVDLERIRTDLEQTEIASRFFSPTESAKLRGLPREEQSEYFFSLWTCKEAFVKAHGGGVTFGLSRFDVQLEPGADSAVIISNEEGEESFSPWLAYRLDPGHGFAGALAAEDRNLGLVFWEWHTTGLARLVD